MIKKYKKYQYFLFVFVIFFMLLSLSQVAHALEIKYPIIPSFPDINKDHSLPEYIEYFFGLAMISAGVLGVFSIVYSGVRLLISVGNPAAAGEARERITGAGLGIILLMFSYILLQTINPALVNLHTIYLNLDVAKGVYKLVPKPAKPAAYDSNGHLATRATENSLFNTLLGIGVAEAVPDKPAVKIDDYIIIPLASQEVVDDEVKGTLIAYHCDPRYEDCPPVYLWETFSCFFDEFDEWNEYCPDAQRVELNYTDITNPDGFTQYIDIDAEGITTTKHIYRTPGIYLYKNDKNGVPCTGDPSEPITESGPIPDAWRGRVTSVQIISGDDKIANGSDVDDPYYGLVFNSTSDATGVCSQPIISFVSGDINNPAYDGECFSVTVNTAASCAAPPPPAQQPARLTVTKVVINGAKTVSDFSLFVNQTPVTSGAQNTFSPGTYTVSEAPDPDYQATFSGNCDATGRITLTAGVDSACTVTNKLQAQTTLTCNSQNQCVVGGGGQNCASNDACIPPAGSTCNSQGQCVQDGGGATCTSPADCVTTTLGCSLASNGICQPGGGFGTCTGQGTSCNAGGGSVCGNSILESGEQCDPPNGTTCNSSCQTIGTGPVCGNGIVESGEQCEPPNTSTCNSICQTIGGGPTTGSSCDPSSNTCVPVIGGSAMACLIGSSPCAVVPLIGCKANLGNCLPGGICTIYQPACLPGGICDTNQTACLLGGICDTNPATCLPSAILTINKVVIGGSKNSIDFHPLGVQNEDTGYITPMTSYVPEYLPAGNYFVFENNTDPAYTASYSGGCDIYGNITLVANNPPNSYTCTITNTYIQQTVLPPPPILMLPVDGAVLPLPNPVGFSWSSSESLNNPSYHIQVSTSPSFSTLSIDANNITTNNFTTVALVANTTYYWRVSVTSGAGTSDWSATSRFTTGTNPTVNNNQSAFKLALFNTKKTNGSIFAKIDPKLSRASLADIILTDTATCEYALPPPGCTFIQGENYDPLTNCGLIQECATITNNKSAENTTTSNSCPITASWIYVIKVNQDYKKSGDGMSIYAGTRYVDLPPDTIKQWLSLDGTSFSDAHKTSLPVTNTDNFLKNYGTVKTAGFGQNQDICSRTYIYPCTQYIKPVGNYLTVIYTQTQQDPLRQTCQLFTGPVDLIRDTNTTSATPPFNNPLRDNANIDVNSSLGIFNNDGKMYRVDFFATTPEQ